MAVESLTICEWSTNSREDEVISHPSWADVEASIRRLDNKIVFVTVGRADDRGACPRPGKRRARRHFDFLADRKLAFGQLSLGIGRRQAVDDCFVILFWICGRRKISARGSSICAYEREPCGAQEG